MSNSKRYKPGTGDALDSTPDLKRRQQAAAMSDLETGEMLDVLDTDHHEIGTKSVPDLPMPDPRAALQEYPRQGQRPTSDGYEFADILTVPCGPPTTADNHDRNPDRRQYAATQASSYSAKDPRNFFLIKGTSSLEINAGSTWQSGPSDNGSVEDHAFEQAGYWTAPGNEGMNWRNWTDNSGVTYEPFALKGIMKNTGLKMLYNAGHGTATSSPEGMDHAVIGASGWFQPTTFGVDYFANIYGMSAADREERLPTAEKWNKGRGNKLQAVGFAKAVHVYNMYRTDLTDKEWEDIIEADGETDAFAAAGLFEALSSDNPLSILKDKKLCKKLLKVIPAKNKGVYADLLRLLAKTIADVHKIRTPDVSYLLKGLDEGKLQWMEVMLWAWSVIGEKAPASADPDTWMVSYSNNNHIGDNSGSHRPGRPGVGDNNHPPLNHLQEAYKFIHDKQHPDCKGPPCHHLVQGGPTNGKYPDGDKATWLRHMWEVSHKREHPNCDGTWAANGKGKWCIHQPGGHEAGYTDFNDLPDSLQKTYWSRLHNPQNLGENCPGTWEKNIARFPESGGYCPHHPKYKGADKKGLVNLSHDYEWLRDTKVLAWKPNDNKNPPDLNMGGHVVITGKGARTYEISRDSDMNFLINGDPPEMEHVWKWEDFWQGLNEQVHVGDGPNGPLKHEFDQIVNNIIQNLNDWKDKTENLEQKVNLISAIVDLAGSKGELEVIWTAIKAVIKSMISIYTRLGSKHKSIDYLVELTERQGGDEGDGVIIPRQWDTTSDQRWSANWFAFTHTPRFFNRTANYSSQAIIALYKLRFNGYLVDMTMQFNKTEWDGLPKLFGDTHSLKMLNWAPTYNPSNFASVTDRQFFNRIPAEYPDPARRDDNHEDFYENNPREAVAVVPMRRRPTCAAQKEWGKICDEQLEIFRPDMCWVMRGKDQKWYPNMAGEQFQIGTQDVGAGETWRISGPTNNEDGVGYYMQNMYTELGFGMQCDVNYNSDNSSHQVIMDVMTARPRSVKNCIKDGKLRIYMNIEAHNLNTSNSNAKEHHKWQLCTIYANFVNRKDTNDRFSWPMDQHREMFNDANPSLGYTFRKANTHGTGDDARHRLSQIGTDSHWNLDDYIDRNDPYKNANAIRKALLLSCPLSADSDFDLLGFTFIMWPGSSSLAGKKWHCFTIKRMRFLKSDEDFIPSYWDCGGRGNKDYDNMPFDYRKLFFNHQRVKSSEDDWVYNNKQTELFNQLGEGME